jgi:hypothetical protein
MTPGEIAAVRDASMNLVRIIADLNDVLAAIRAASGLVQETLARVEDDLVNIADDRLSEHGAVPQHLGGPCCVGELLWQGRARTAY